MIFVIIKLELPSNFPHNIAPSISRNDVVQAKEHHHDQANEDLMEEDDGTNKVNDPMEEDDGTNQMIQDLFSPDEDGENAGIYDEPLLEKANKRLYEGSRANILSATLLLVNLKVMNNLSNTCMTHILRYVICFISYCT
jgi:hypothetical protein